MTGADFAPDGRRVEGTFWLEGLLEGRLGTPDVADRVRAWVGVQAAAALHFTLEVDGPTFSLLPSKEPVRASALRPDPGVRVEEALAALVQTLPADVRGELYSTLHSVEVRPNQEVQCVYAVTAAGAVKREERIVAADTVAPVPPPSAKALAMRTLAALGAVAVLFGLSSFFVDWGETFRGLWHQVSPLAPDDVQVDATAFDGHFSVTKQEIGRESRSVVLTVTRGPRFPTTLDGPPPAPATWRASLADGAAARGWLRAELFDAKGAYLGASDVRVTELRTKETAELVVPVPREPRPARIVLVP